VENRNIVVLGGSAGSLSTFTQLVRDLGADFPAALLAVIHRHPTSGNWLASLLASLTSLPVLAPDDAPLELGHIYIAQPDRHLIVDEGRVRSMRGPRENQFRPAIDVLFRSAAVTYTSRVIGVLLSGELDDGTSGLHAIKRCGGVTLVQDPESTTYSTMLDVALTNVGADRVVNPHELLSVLRELIATPAPKVPPPPAQLIAEARIATGTQAITTDQFTAGPPTSLSCPECGGPLWERGDGTEFRCLIGHAYALETLQRGSDAALDRTLWAAIRQFEQRANIARTMAHQSRGRDQKVRADLHESRAKEAEAHAQRLRELQARYRAGSE